MNIFDELGKIYSEIDNIYTNSETQAHSIGDYEKETEYSKKRQLNDQAYFLFMFTRFEGRIRDISDNLINLIDNKITTPLNWKEKRAWEIIIHKQKSNVHFMDRVAFLTTKGEKDYNLIQKYYDQRNNIGHGKKFTIPISIPTVIADMKRLYKDLEG